MKKRPGLAHFFKKKRILYTICMIRPHHGLSFQAKLIKRIAAEQEANTFSRRPPKNLLFILTPIFNAAAAHVTFSSFISSHNL